MEVRERLAPMFGQWSREMGGNFKAKTARRRAAEQTSLDILRPSDQNATDARLVGRPMNIAGWCGTGPRRLME